MTSPDPNGPQQVQVPLVDVGNPMLSQIPSRMDTGTIDIPGAGTLGVITIRTQSTTLTVMLSPEDVKTWAGILTGLAGQMGGGLVQATPVDVMALDEITKRLEQGPTRRKRGG